MEEKFEIKKVHINKVMDWSQYITMDSTQEETPTSSIGDCYNELKVGNCKIPENSLKNKSIGESNDLKNITVEGDDINKDENKIFGINNETDKLQENKENNSVSDNIQKKLDSLNRKFNTISKDELSITKRNGNRTRRAEHQSGVPGVYWQESSQRWIAQWSDSITGRRITHGFSARVYGFEEAKQMAIKSRVDAIEKGKATARKLHENDYKTKLYSNKNQKVNLDESNSKEDGDIQINNKEKKNLRKIMSNMSDKSINLLLEEMKHLREDNEYEGIFWHPINKVWIGVWLDSITHETYTQSFAYEISEDGIDISRLKVIEWRLKLINEKKLRDNAVEYVNNKEFKSHGNYYTNNFLNVGGINGCQPNNIFLPNHHQIFLNQLNQLVYNSIDNCSISNLLLNNNCNNTQNIGNQNNQNFLNVNLINTLISNYLNNYYHCILKQVFSESDCNANYFDFNFLLSQVTNSNFSDIKSKNLINNLTSTQNNQNLNLLQAIYSNRDFPPLNNNIFEAFDQYQNIFPNPNDSTNRHQNSNINNIIKKIVKREIDTEISKIDLQRDNENTSENFKNTKIDSSNKDLLSFELSSKDICANSNLVRSITSSSESSILSNSTNLSILKNANKIVSESATPRSIPNSSALTEINSSSPTVTSTPMSSSSKLKIVSPSKKSLDNLNYKSGIPGVYWKTRDQEWVAEWYDHNRKRHSRHFYVKKYGFNEAKKLAIQCRLNAVNSGKAVLRNSNNQNNIIHDNHSIDENI